MRYCVLPDEALAALLADDVPHGDLTSEALGIGRRAGRLTFRARGAMTLCGVEEAVRLFALAGCQARPAAASGAELAPGSLILEAEGSAGALHRVWKVAQTLVEWASGIASSASALVAAARPVPVACTRKTPPGAKALAIKAVRAGGAGSHRLGLSESLLVFAEHRLFLEESPGATVARLRAGQPEKKVVVEVGSVDEARRWGAAGAEVLQLEKFIPEQVAACRAALEEGHRRPLLAAAGGIHSGNAGAYVIAGADLLVTSAPYTAPPRDVQVTFFAA
ncbi:MAG: ModD protein [Betaproteobacteria bacterium]|nr:ModD protein [Betaproteobacteria bacterium]